MAKKDYEEPKSYGTPLRPNRSTHDSAWRNPRDDDRDPAPRDPGMDRYSVTYGNHGN